MTFGGLYQPAPLEYQLQSTGDGGTHSLWLQGLITPVLLVTGHTGHGSVSALSAHVSPSLSHLCLISRIQYQAVVVSRHPLKNRFLQLVETCCAELGGYTDSDHTTAHAPLLAGVSCQ